MGEQPYLGDLRSRWIFTTLPKGWDDPPSVKPLARGLKKQLQEQADQHTAQIQDPQNAPSESDGQKKETVLKNRILITLEKHLKKPLGPSNLLDVYSKSIGK